VAIVIGGSTGFAGVGLETRTASAADLPVTGFERPARSPHARGAAPSRLEDFASKAPNLNCTAWTDGCRSCGKAADGVHCSNIGIACQSSEPRCTQR
jgi:hypothetical protein